MTTMRSALLPSLRPMPFHIIKHCAQECEYQRSGEMSVYWMLTAWEWAQRASKDDPDLAACIWLGKLVEPKKNKTGFRKVGVRVGSDVKMNWQNVKPAMEKLFKFGVAMPPEEFFREYEEIHPFVDGNGRTGNILYNWLNGTLDSPLMPPDFWGQGRIEGSVS